MRFRFLLALALVTPVALAQRPDDSVQPAAPVHHAGTLHLATGIWVPANGQPEFVTPGVIYDNTCPTPNFSSLISGNTNIDEGRLPSTTSPAPNTGSFNTYRVTSFQIGYCTRELDTGMGGPGATVQVAFFQDYDDCTATTANPPAQAAFTISNLPASAAQGTLSCWTVTINLTGGFEFHLLADANGAYDGVMTLDGFGYSLSMPNQTGTTTATSGGFLIAGDTTPPGDCAKGDATYYKNPAAPNGTGLDNDDIFYREGTAPGQTTNACLFFGGNPHAGFYMRITGDLDDCNGNAIPDQLDISSGNSADCNSNDVPDECDIASGTSSDCNANAMPDECELASGSASDCNMNGVLDECDIAAGTSNDCNANAMPDECELASGSASDCNMNGVLDECDITAGTSGDCNANTVPDECDIASGGSTDIDMDGVPDECEAANSTAYCFGDGSGPACPCGNTGMTGQGCANSTGQGARQFKVNSTSVSADDMQLHTINVPAGEIGIYFLGMNQVNNAFGDGRRCVGVVLRRYPVQTASPNGVLSQLNVVSQSMGLITMGSTWNFQAWYRDMTGPCSSGVNMSNGLQVVFTP